MRYAPIFAALMLANIVTAGILEIFARRRRAKRLGGTMSDHDIARGIAEANTIFDGQTVDVLRRYGRSTGMNYEGETELPGDFVVNTVADDATTFGFHVPIDDMDAVLRFAARMVEYGIEVGRNSKP